MTLMHWDKNYILGVSMIDRDHEHLFTLVNDFHNVFFERHERKDIARVLNALIQYSEAHFRREEELMASEEYPGLPAHQELHIKLIEAVFQLQDQFENQRIALDNNVVKFLRDWLGDHIVHDDRKFADFLAGKRKTPPAAG